jgi:hypothetical protein
VALELIRFDGYLFARYLRALVSNDDQTERGAGYVRTLDQDDTEH